MGLPPPRALEPRSCLSSSPPRTLPLPQSGAPGAPGASLSHCSVPGPHGGGQRPSPLARGIQADAPTPAPGNPNSVCGAPGCPLVGVTSPTGAHHILRRTRSRAQSSRGASASPVLPPTPLWATPHNAQSNCGFPPPESPLPKTKGDEFYFIAYKKGFDRFYCQNIFSSPSAPDFIVQHAPPPPHRRRNPNKSAE